MSSPKTMTIGGIGDGELLQRSGFMQDKLNELGREISVLRRELHATIALLDMRKAVDTIVDLASEDAAQTEAAEIWEMRVELHEIASALAYLTSTDYTRVSDAHEAFSKIRERLRR